MALPFLQTDKQKFLDSQAKWSKGLGEGWKGTKFLGMGCFGVTGLWEYQGGSLADLCKKKPGITKVVVKMAQVYPSAFDPKSGRTALDEGEIGRIVTGFNSKHLIRQFGGNRVGDQFSEMEDVVRVFLEYCPGGSLHALLKQADSDDPKPIPEIDLWQIFDCLARGVYAMERETEEMNVPGAPAYTGRDEELMHCDLKPDNVFLGYRDNEHSRFPISKIADFGEALFVDSYDLQDDESGAKYLERGAPAFKPPEEAINKPFGGWQKSGIPLLHARKGTCSNIWQVGAIMNAMILRAHMDFNPDEIKNANPPLVNISKLRSPSAQRQINLGSQLNHSQGLEDKVITDLYTAQLLTLIQECLFREPEYRPKCDELVEYANLGLQKANKELGPSGWASVTEPEIVDPYDKVPILSSGTPPEPPTSWKVAHVKLPTGEFVDARDLEPVRKGMLSSALDALPSSFVARISRSTTPGPKTPPPSPLSPGGLAKTVANGLVGMAGVGAKYIFDAAVEQSKKRKRSAANLSSSEKEDEFEII
ncbi:kinase-like protein [Mollisia scopiformis]|uniref:Kinase-like protein n=1 Tax=Mollisia scopiformis TaxID=149040 RepID=A0A194WSG4_MOLSC|nr:kinase-like protein [Mollisia scopiformis]KUJ10905.1 kinase-like protein [Mollisia scopiformis]